jgi:hypothetical protein
VRPTTPRARLAIALAISLIAGIAIGWMDSRPGWDDTAITALSLVLASGVAAFIAGSRPWLVAITTGVFVPLFELPGLGGGGALAAFLFSGIGAAAGWLAAR